MTFIRINFYVLFFQLAKEIVIGIFNVSNTKPKCQKIIVGISTGDVKQC